MKVQTQTLLVIGFCTLLFFSFLYFFIQPSLLEEANDFDKHNIITDMNRVEKFTAIEKDNLNRLNGDWAVWDDSYSFIQTESEQYFKSNLTDGTFVNNQLNYMMYVRGKEEVIYARGYDFLKEEELPIPPGLINQLLSIAQDNNTEELTFLWEDGSKPVIFSIRSIFRSGGKGESRGKLIMGRIIDETYISNMGNALSLSLSINPDKGSYENDEVEIINNQLIQGNLNLTDLYDQPILQINMLQERSFFQEKKQSMNQLMGNLFSAILVLTLVTFIVFRKLFITPVARLAAQMKEIRFGENFTIRLQAKTSSIKEITELEESINTMLCKLETTHGEVLKLAYQDSLTSLSNRVQLYQEFISFARRHNNQVAVLFFDLDGFKRVNDTWGHSVGDSLLIRVADRLQACFSHENSIIARIGGDEFVVVTTYQDSAHLKAKAKKINDKINEEYVFGQVKTYVSSSIGISQFPEDSTQFEDLLKFADMAMYEAKMKGKNQFVFYHSLAQGSRYQELFAIKNDLIYALANKQFHLVYQPIHHAMTNEILAVEALLRWNHPEQGLISPEKFIPILEETGQINEVGRWVLEESVKQVKKWHEAGHRSLSLAVNFSKTQLKEKDLFLQHLDTVLKRHKFPSERLQVEITESDIAVFDYEIINFVQGLQARSIKVSLDDFGVGVSSLYGLRNIPVDIIKIDRSFINRIPNQSFDASLLTGLYQILRELHIEVVTEGIETEDQLKFVMDHSDSQLQGYFLNEPKSASEIDEQLFPAYQPDTG